MTRASKGVQKVIPGDSGRRSRRGFAYQDTVTLLACLDMKEKGYLRVSWEDEEDVQCVAPSGPIYKQVKTQEGPQTRFSIAEICRPEKEKNPHTSILGKLFSGKRLPEGTRFSLVVNETPQANLFCFVSANDNHDRSHLDEHKSDIVKRLTGLSVPDDRDVAWCVDRFELEVKPRSIDDIEAEALRRLQSHATEIIGTAPLVMELENTLIAILTCISRSAQASQVTAWTPDEFHEQLSACIANVIGINRDGGLAPLMPLRDKLSPAGLSEEESNRIAESMTRFRRVYRSSVGLMRERLNDLSDDIYAICVDVMAKRRCGKISPGADSYHATLHGIAQLPQVLSGEVPLRHAHALLSDITARCQNRYADAS